MPTDRHLRAAAKEYQPASVFVHHMPDVTIELVSIKESPHLKPIRLQVRGKLLVIDVTKLRPMPKIVGGLAEFAFGKFYLAERLALCVVLQTTSMLLSSKGSGTCSGSQIGEGLGSRAPVIERKPPLLCHRNTGRTD